MIPPPTTTTRACEGKAWWFTAAAGARVAVFHDRWAISGCRQSIACSRPSVQCARAAVGLEWNLEMHNGPRDSPHGTRPGTGKWALFASISAIFFLISGATFSSLGVVLPAMIADMSWTQFQAGSGFSLFAFTVGLASTVPAWALRRFGIKATYGAGGAIMTLGFCLLASTHNLEQYFIAAALLGLGFSSCATVPALYLLAGWMPERRSAAIGEYMTIGGLGAVAGPAVAGGILAATHSWRVHCWTMA